MASLTSVAFTSIGQTSCQRKVNVSSTRSLSSNFEGFRFRTSVFCHCVSFRASSSSSRMVIQCMSTAPGELFLSFFLYFFLTLNLIYVLRFYALHTHTSLKESVLLISQMEKGGF